MKAVVTGASSGLGRHLAATLPVREPKLILAALWLDALAEAAAEIENLGERCSVVSLDLNDSASIAAMANDVRWC